MTHDKDTVTENKSQTSVMHSTRHACRAWGLRRNAAVKAATSGMSFVVHELAPRCSETVNYYRPTSLHRYINYSYCKLYAMSHAFAQKFRYIKFSRLLCVWCYYSYVVLRNQVKAYRAKTTRDQKSSKSRSV